MMGVVRRDEESDGDGSGDNWRLTGLGSLLRTDDSHSMRSLALMYAGTFYQSFTGLAHTVRTGLDGFEHVFGTHHFDHFSRHPDLADLFQQSMAASARMFDLVPEHPVFAAAAASAAEQKRSATVVDIAGGTGALLGRVLTAHPAAARRAPGAAPRGAGRPAGIAGRRVRRPL